MVGDLVLDVLVRAGRPLAHGSDVRGAVEFLPGGSAANFAVWASRLGASVSFCGAVGTDFIGDHLVADLRAEGVECSGAVRIPGRSPSVFALIGADGERTMVTDRRATLAYGASHVSVETLTGARHLHLTAYSLFDDGPAGAAIEAARLARASGASISLDLSSAALLEAHGARRTREEIATLRPEVIFGNEEEFLALSQQQGIEKAADGLLRLAPVVVLKRGREGCLLATPDQVRSFEGDAVHPLDTTGAGDAFDAAWVCSWLRGNGFEQACAAANRLAARVVLVSGARGNPLGPLSI